MGPNALIIVESTVPIGVCENVVLPILRSERLARGIEEPVLLAHAYERVMPGPNYTESIRNFWRTFSGVDERSTSAAREFLSSFINVGDYPLWNLSETNASEMAKVLENSYRAVNIAFIHEWTLLAEKIGVNLFEVIDSIRVRKGTHDNIRLPGFGVGGYCLTKDPLLAQWSATNLFKTDVVLEMTLDALRVNQRMPLHTFDLALELAGGRLKDCRVAVLGISYLPEIPDARNTPSQELIDALLSAGALVLAHDPYLSVWLERGEVRLTNNLEECISWADGLIVATPHNCYRRTFTKDFAGASCRFVVDAQNGIDDAAAAAMHSRGLSVAGVGKGHWRKKGLHLHS
jgi:nucleotide sugar dehydrogenase